MPIQIPTLKRMDPVAPESVGRMDINTPDLPKNVLGETVEKLGGAFVEQQQKYEDAEIDLTATKAAVDYQVKYKTGLAKLKEIEGDPTEHYIKFDEESTAWESETMQQYEGASDRTKAAIREKISRAKLLSRDDRGVSEAMQHQVFEKNTRKAAIQLEQEGVLSAIEVLDVNDAESFTTLDVRLDNIRKQHIQSGRSNGLVGDDGEGNETLSPILKSEMKKDVSLALQNAIQTLNASGRPDEAEAIMMRYEDELTVDATNKLLSGTKDSRVKNKALALVDKYKHLPYDEQMEKFDQEKDLQVRAKAGEFAEAESRRRENMQIRAGKQTYENLAEYVKSRSDNGHPFTTVKEMEADETYQKLEAGRTNAKQRAALANMVEKPKRSDDDALGAAYDLSVSPEGFTGMTYSEFNEKVLTGLSEKDQAMFSKKWQSDNTETGVEKRQMVSYMGSQLEKDLLTAGVVKRPNGRLSNTDRKKINEYYGEMMATIERFPPGTSVQDQHKWVKGFVEARLKDQIFTGLAKPTPKFQSAPKPTGTPAPAKAAEKAAEMSKEEKIQWAKKFYQVNKRPWTPKDDLGAFIKSQGGKL